VPRAWAHPTGRLVRAVAVGLLVVVAIVWWVGRGTGSGPVNAASPTASATSATPRASAADIAQIASAAGCAARLTGENSGYRQAGCVTADDRFTITTFSTDQGQRDWLAEALPYGGAYLVGLRWVVSANARTGLAALAARLGGTILDQTAQHHS
jgi:hypothetical protein